MTKYFEEELAILKEDVEKIILDDHYKGRIVKTDLIRELRHTWMHSHVDLGHAWKLGAYFINRELEDHLEEWGFSIEKTTKGRFYAV
jgi:hypothetical protein